MKDLVYSLKKYFSVFLHFQKINVMKMMAYPLSFFISCLAVIVTMALSIIFIKVNFGYVNSVAGWTFYQILAVVGSYMIVEGFMWVLFSNLNSLNSLIREGLMDGVLLKPIDSQFLVSFWRGDLEDSVRIIIGTFLLFISVENTIGFNFLHLVLFVMLIFNGLVTFYSFALFLRSFSFWLIDGSGFWLLVERVSTNSQYPVDIYYNKIVRGLFTYLIPLAFMATVPARMLTSVDIDWKFTALSFLMVGIFFFGSRAFWKFSLNHYSSASS